jgi:RNA polymerase sigma factor for flagellar operon FliA
MQTGLETAARLSPEQAEQLWRAWRLRGDREARDRLILSYAPMVTYIASRKLREAPAHLELDDIVSCGLIALMESIERFDPERGATFEQYAWRRVAGAVVDELRRTDWAPRAVRRLSRRLEETRAAHYARSGRYPSPEELAQALEISVEDVQANAKDVEQAELVSLNAPARSAAGNAVAEIGETVEADWGEGQPETAALRRERVAEVRRAVETKLDDQERTVLALVHLHGLSGAEVGRMLGVTDSRVSQILGSARRKLQAHLQAYEAPAAPAA